jgi:hypothetical protein
MTYEDLLVQLLTLETSQLKEKVTVFNVNDKEYYAIKPEKRAQHDVNTTIFYL